MAARQRRAHPDRQGEAPGGQPPLRPGDRRPLRPTLTGKGHAPMSDYDPYSYEVKRDPYPHYEKLRKTCPVHHHALDSVDVDRINANPLVARPTTEFWSVMRYQDCVDVLQNAALFASGQGPGPERLVALCGVGMLIYADQHPHPRQARIAGQGCSPGTVDVGGP